jgi:ribosomal protein L11 methyltransferase
MSYKEIKFTHTTEETGSILIALLSASGYEGFEEEGSVLKAFIPESLFRQKQLEDIAHRLHLKYSIHTIPETNWNAVWESNFHPVVVDDFCAIRADFHEPIQHVAHEIIITPKMSFGTGHHATTFMMIKQMEGIDFPNKRVLDFGTGTGVLAILAGQLGAISITAIDNDEWSIANAAENFSRNNSNKIDLKKADTANVAGTFDIILANITRNVILDNFSLFISHLADDGILLLSGLLQEDEQHIVSKAAEYALHQENKTVRDNWISMRFRK